MALKTSKLESGNGLSEAFDGRRCFYPDPGAMTNWSTVSSEAYEFGHLSCHCRNWFSDPRFPGEQLPGFGVSECPV